MNKAQLIKKVAASTGLSEKDVAEVISSVVDVITNAVMKGDDVTIPNFGRFTKMKIRARVGRNPKTGKAVKLAARWYLRFQTSKGLKDRIDGRMSWTHF